MATENQRFLSQLVREMETLNLVADINREPETWRTVEDPSHKAWESFYNDDEALLPLFLSPTIMDTLRCSCCRKYLSVGPIFYERIPQEIYKVCGRCFRDPASKVQKQRLRQDNLYEKLLPRLMFKCSYASCKVTLKWTQVKKHETNCTFQSQIEPETDEHDNDNLITMPKGKSFMILLSCDLCSNPLSVFPVLSNGRQIICGRCNELKQSTETWTEQLIYSMMCHFVTFSCAIGICPRALKLNEVVQHESNCRSTIVQCDVNNCRKLKWPFEMSIHIRNHHMQEAIGDRLAVEEQRSLFQIDGEPYIVSITEVNEKLLCCAVYGLDEIEYGKLTLEIVSDTRVLESFQIQITRFNKKFKSEHGKQIKRKWNKPVFLRLVKVKVQVENGRALDEKSRDDFECKVCYTYMTRLIFLCENKHPICDRCKKRVGTICPMCRGRMEANRRHFHLENEAAKFQFPCSLRDQNKCKVSLTPKFLTAHEDVCRPLDDFPFNNCFVAGCAAKFHSYEYNVFFNHCAERHLDSVMYSGGSEYVEWWTDKPRNGRRAVLFFQRELFYVVLQFDGNKGLSFGISHIVPGSRKYRYTLELHSKWRSVQKKNVCDELGAAPKLLYVEPEVVKDMVNGDLAAASKFSSGPTSNWLEYRVTLEEHKRPDYPQTFYYDGSDLDSSDEEDRENWYGQQSDSDDPR